MDVAFELDSGNVFEAISDEKPVNPGSGAAKEKRRGCDRGSTSAYKRTRR